MAIRKTNDGSNKGGAAARPDNSIIDFGDFDEKDAVSSVASASADDINALLDGAGILASEAAVNIDGYESADDLLLISGSLGAGFEVDQLIEPVPQAAIEDNIEDFFESYEFSSPVAVNSFVDQVSRSITGEEEQERLPEEQDILPLPVSDDSYGSGAAWAEPEPEPDLAAEAQRYASADKGAGLRLGISAVTALVALWLTFAVERGWWFPFELGEKTLYSVGALLLLQLLCAAMGIRTLIRGAGNLLHAEPGIESLIFLSGLFTVLDGMSLLAQKNTDAGMPYSAIFALAMTFCILSDLLYSRSMHSSLSAAANMPSPVGVITDIDTFEDRTVIKKLSRRTEGFYRNLTQEDFSDTCYRVVAPILMVLSVSLAAIVSIGRGETSAFFRAFAALLTVSASLTAALAYVLPFNAVSTIAIRAGTVIAGWGGAQMVADSDSALITDEDIYPAGTVGIDNVTIFGDDRSKAIIYAASLMIASGSGLSRCFADLLRQQKLNIARVYNFSFSESGGVQGIIKGEKVTIGNSGYMNLLGMRIPADRDKNNAVYMAVGQKLYARYDLSYVPSNTVQRSLLSLVKTRISILFAVRDFNVTPASVKQKFKIPVDNVEHLSVTDCYAISTNQLTTPCDCMAVLAKDSAGPFAAAIAGGQSLRNSTIAATVVAAAGSILGVLLVFSLFWFGTDGIVSVGNLATYMFINSAAQILLSVFARKG